MKPLSPVVQRVFKLTLKSVASLLLLLFITLLLLLWRLSSSPIQLNQFVPRIEHAASALPGGLRVKLKGIGLFWNRAERQIDLRALNVELVESSGSSLVSMPEVDVSLSVFALMRGVVALSSIELRDVDVQLVRKEDGSFQIFRKTNAGPVVGSDSKPRDFTEMIQHISKVLASEADPQSPLSYLKKLKIKGSLEVEDRKNGLHWAADAVESLIVGHKGEVQGDLGVTFSSPQALDSTHADIVFDEAGNPLKLQLRGAAQIFENAVSLKLEAALQQLKVNDFDLYWPKEVAQGARKWLVANLKAGVVNSAKLDLDMVVPIGPESDFQLKRLKGSVDYSDLTVSYFGSLPPATGVTGSGTFDQRGFDLGISKGLVNDVAIESGSVVISGMDNKQAAISIKTHLNGQLADVFAVLEAPPIELSSDSVTGLVSEQLGGQIEADFSIAFPLAFQLTNEDIHYQASGKISEGVLKKIYRNYDLQAANLDFNLDQAKLNINGPLAFSGIPLTIDWTTSLAGPGKGHTDFTINSPNITGAQISTLGYDVSEYLQGNIALKATTKVAPGGLVTASIESDLNNAALAIPQIHWNKATGDGGNIDFTLLIEKNHLHAEDINIELGRLKTSGNVEFDMAGPLMSLTMEHLSLPYAQLNGLKLERTESKNLQFTLEGGEASLEPFLSGNNQDSDPLKKQVAVESEAIIDQLESLEIVLEVGKSKLDKVYLNKETYFDTIQFSGHWDTKGWHQVNLSGHNPFGGSKAETSSQLPVTGKLESGQFIVVYGPFENGRYPLHIEAEDLGSLASAVKGKNVMKGGYLVLNGESQGPLLTKPIQATLEVNSFTVKEAPFISSVLNMASLTQIISTFSQKGLAFNSASGDLQLHGTRLSSKQIRMKGGSLGLLASGWVDLKQQNIELNGTIVPLSKLNVVVGNIPLLGQVVIGNDGKGIMAVDYTAKGTIGQPEVSIRKASPTPGILKNTLGLGMEDSAVDPQ